jgi:hypothetical protein
MRADELTAAHKDARVKFNSPFQGVIVGRIADIYDTPGFTGNTVSLMIHNPVWKHAYDTYHLDGGVEVEMIEWP